MNVRADRLPAPYMLPVVIIVRAASPTDAAAWPQRPMVWCQHCCVQGLAMVRWWNWLICIWTPLLWWALCLMFPQTQGSWHAIHRCEEVRGCLYVLHCTSIAVFLSVYSTGLTKHLLATCDVWIVTWIGDGCSEIAKTGGNFQMLEFNLIKILPKQVQTMSRQLVGGKSSK